MAERISRRELLSLPLVVPALSLGALAQRPVRRKLNVLFIAVDDLNNRIGCYGDPVVKTPNIDRLASRGVRFDRAYCQYPLCNPSRTSLLSGLHPDATQIFDNRTPPRTTLKDTVFLPEFFRQQGYFTGRVGKIAHGLFEDAVKWDVSESAAGRTFTPADREQRLKRQAAEQGANKLTWVPTDNPDDREPDGRTARRIVQLMEENKDRLFFLGAGFHKPHLPWIAPKKYFDLYPPEKIELPKTPPDDREDIPPVALTRTAGDEAMSEMERKQAIAAYHAATSFMDAQVGVLLKAMDRLKLWDRTVVLLFGDHGWHLDEHLGLWRKMTVFEESARAPLIVAAPDKKANAACPRLVEFVDFFPTLTELCGQPTPQGLEGISFVPLLDDPERRWKKAAFTQVQRGRDRMGRSVRTERYRYTEWASDKVAELYDHQADPHEFRNLAGDAQVAKVQEELKRLLHQGWRVALP